MENLIINKKIKDTKIAVAMSGGVDSSVVAVMLRKIGYNVTGFTMRLYSNSNNVNKNKSCCAGVDINDAVKIANQYDFPHHILDLQNNFYNNVIDDYIVDDKTKILIVNIEAFYVLFAAVIYHLIGHTLAPPIKGNNIIISIYKLLNRFIVLFYKFIVTLLK